jgi:uncharacterized membrane-anchored protein YitT (DUF2179 family)
VELIESYRRAAISSYFVLQHTYNNFAIHQQLWNTFTIFQGRGVWSLSKNCSLWENCHATEKSEAIARARRCRASRLTG